MEKRILDFLRNNEISISTKTKARGHLGYFQNNKISISKNLSKEKQLQVLLHEFAHKIHSEIEPQDFSRGGNIENLFQTTESIEEELLKSISIQFKITSHHLLKKEKVSEGISEKKETDIDKSSFFR